MERKNDTINFVKAVESKSGQYVIVTFVRFMDEKREYLKWIVPKREISKPDKPYIYGTLLDLMIVDKPAPKKEEAKKDEKTTSTEVELEQDPLPF